MNLNFIKPYLTASGQFLRNLDVGTTGADDLIGALLIYAAQAISAVESAMPLPPLPEILKKPVTEKLGKGARNSLLGVSILIGITAAQTSGKVQLILMYVNGVLTSLLQEEPIEPIDPDLGTADFAQPLKPSFGDTEGNFG